MDYPPSIQLFLLFGRIEYALKRGGFLKGAVSFVAEADWDKFAKRLGREFFNSHRDNNSVPEIFRLAPRKAIVEEVDEGGTVRRKLGWENTSIPRSTQDLLGAVRRVRNNLFHGDKSNPDYGRNTLLIQEALVVLRDAEVRARATESLAALVPHLNRPAIGE